MRTLTLCCIAFLLLAALAGPIPAAAQAASDPGVSTGGDGTACNTFDTPVEPDPDAPGQIYPNDAPNTVDADASAFDSLAYMQNTISPNGLCSDDTAWPQCVHYTQQGNRLYYVKGEDGRYFERFAWDNSYISLERDTTWGNDGLGNNSYDAMPYGSLRWAKRSWTLNEQFTYSTRIVGFNNMGTGSCNYAQHPHEYNDSNYKQLISTTPRCWGGDLPCPVNTIGIYYPSGNEVHWYAQGWGWVAWEHPRGTIQKIWNHRAGKQVAPVDSCAATLGSWQAVFLGVDTIRGSGYGEWDFCRHKASCAPGETVNGVSEVPGAFARTALCRVHGGGYPGGMAGVVKAETGDSRRYSRSVNGTTDWDPGYWKLECGLNEYVAGTSNNAMECYGNTRFHAALCATAASVSAVCSVRPFDSGDNRVTTTSGDWDFGAYKGECGLTSYVAGISVSPSTGRPHALLCCHP